MNISALILTYNEEANLPRCLEALAWCDDIVVLDSGSTDRTVEIARSYGARLLTRPFDTFANQRNFGLQTGIFRHEWVVHLDADEVVTPEFKTALDRLVPEPGILAFRVPSKLMLHDRWLRHAGMYPTYQVRLGHRDRLRFKQVGHGQREDLPASALATFDQPYLHYNFSQGLAAWLRKHLRYAEDEARLIDETRAGRAAWRVNGATASATDRRRALKHLSARIPLILRPSARFLYVFLLRRGFMDGKEGLLYALMLAVYEGMIAVLAWDSIGRVPVRDEHTEHQVTHQTGAKDVT